MRGSTPEPAPRLAIAAIRNPSLANVNLARPDAAGRPGCRNLAGPDRDAYEKGGGLPGARNCFGLAALRQDDTVGAWWRASSLPFLPATNGNVK
jgi:hypothetical protein